MWLEIIAPRVTKARRRREARVTLGEVTAPKSPLRQPRPRTSRLPAAPGAPPAKGFYSWFFPSFPRKVKPHPFGCFSPPPPRRGGEIVETLKNQPLKQQKTQITPPSQKKKNPKREKLPQKPRGTPGNTRNTSEQQGKSREFAAGRGWVRGEKLDAAVRNPPGAELSRTPRPKEPPAG